MPVIADRTPTAARRQGNCRRDPLTAKRPFQCGRHVPDCWRRAGPVLLGACRTVRRVRDTETVDSLTTGTRGHTTYPRRPSVSVLAGDHRQEVWFDGASERCRSTNWVHLPLVIRLQPQGEDLIRIRGSLATTRLRRSTSSGRGSTLRWTTCDRGLRDVDTGRRLFSVECEHCAVWRRAGTRPRLAADRGWRHSVVIAPAGEWHAALSMGITILT